MLITVNERSNATYRVTLRDTAGNPLTSARVNALTLYLYDVATDTVINGRAGQNVKNTNNVTLDEAGILTWQVQPADNIIVGATSPERHLAVFWLKYDSNAGEQTWTVDLDVIDIPKFP